MMQREFQKAIDSLDEIFQFLKSFLDEERVDEAAEFAIDLVVEELFTSMVKYDSGDSDRISVSVERVDSQVVLRLVDFDVDPFDPSSVEEVDVDRPLEERNAGGLGLHLVKSIVDKITYEYEDRKMTVTVVKNVGC